MLITNELLKKYQYYYDKIYNEQQKGVVNFIEQQSGGVYLHKNKDFFLDIGFGVYKKGLRTGHNPLIFFVVAGTGFEPMTFGL